MKKTQKYTNWYKTKKKNLTIQEEKENCMIKIMVVIGLVIVFGSMIFMKF